METNSHDEEILYDRQYQAAVAESDLNGTVINWRYWVHQLPTQTGAEAALLMSGLDPDLFKSLESRSNRNDQSLHCKKAAMIQRLAERECKGPATPREWLSWARAHQIKVHDGYVLEVESASERASGTETKSPMVVEIALDAPAAQQPQAEAPAERVAGFTPPEPKPAPVAAESGSVVTHSTKTRRDTLTPVIELAQRQCRNPKDTAEVWAALLVLAEKKSAPLIGATEEGLQYLNNGSADNFKRDSLRKRLAR